MDEVTLPPNGERPSSASAFRLGDWVVEPSLNRVSRGERALHVRRQLIDLLAFLASRPGQVVSKEEIFRAVWPGQFVAETGLARCISQLRDVFEDDPRDPHVIETIPTRGYRLVAPVLPFVPPTATPSESLPAPVPGTPVQPGDTSVAIDPMRAAAPPARGHRRIGAGTAVAVLVVAAAVAAWLAVRTPTLGDDDTLVVSFENQTGDPVFDDTLRLALTIQLEQSPLLRVVSEQRIREELAYMKRPADDPVVGAVAMDVCQRVGARAVLTGSITSLGGQYVIGLEGVACPSGKTLLRRQTETARKEAVIAGLGAVVSEVRRQLGESVASVQADVPLVKATTSSLEALKALTSGDRERSRGHDAEAIQAYQRAIEADPQFALAHGRLGVHLLSLTRTGEAIDALKRAFALRERASVGERQYITSYYYTQVVRDPVKAVAVLEAWRDAYPRNPTPRVSLGELYVQTGRFDLALAEGREALRLQPGDATAASVVVDALTCLDRWDEAKRMAEAEVAAGRGNATMRVALLLIAFAQGDAAAMRRHQEWAASNPAGESLFATTRAANAMFGGRMRDAEVLWQQRAERAEARGDHALAALTTAGAAIHEAFVGRASEVRTLTTAALTKPETPDTVLRAAFALALIGYTDAAEQRFTQYQRMPDVEAGSDPQWRAPTQALIEIERGRPDHAIELLAAVKPFELGLACVPNYVRGLAYMRAKRPREAAAQFAIITEHRGALVNALVYPLAWLQLARAHAAAGDGQSARQAYERFLQYWKDADPDVPALAAARAGK